MPLQLESQVRGRVHVLACKGDIVFGDEIDRLDEILQHDIRRRVVHVVLNLTQVGHMDSSGLGLVVRHATNLRRQGGDMRLAGVPPVIGEVLRTTRVSSILTSYPTVEEAVTSFGLPPMDRPVPEKHGGRVLIVDPSADFCSFARAVLSSNGYVVRCAGLIRDAKLLLNESKPDYILIGPKLARFGTHDAAHAMKAAWPAAEVIQLSPEFEGCDLKNCADILLDVLEPQDQEPAK